MIVVAIGAGTQRYRRSKISRKMASTVRHLNGEAAPPPGLVTFFEELPQSARSAFSARSAASASEKQSDAKNPER
jgi:hypothetical protein